MALQRPKALVSLTAAAIMAAGLAGCGRLGPLDPPPASVAPPVRQSAVPTTPATGAAQPMTYPSVAASGAASPENSVKNGFDAQGNPIAGPGAKKGFFLDFLLN